MLLELNRLDLAPGDRLHLRQTSWQEFEQILAELGEHRAARAAYYQGTLELVVPLPEHEDAKEIVGDLLKALLEECDRECRSLGSTTFKNPLTAAGIEPDQCFYIQNELAIRGKSRLDLTVDPPPDLALEIEITSRTHPETYAALGVPELWRFEGGQLQIAVLREGAYEVVSESPTFPGLPLLETIPAYLDRSKADGRNRTLRAFRAQVRAWLG